MRHEQDYGRIVQREDFLRTKHDRQDANVRLSVHSPPTRDHGGVVREGSVPMRDVMQAVRDNGASPAHSLAQTIHHIQNSYAFNGLQGPPL